MEQPPGELRPAHQAELFEPFLQPTQEAREELQAPQTAAGGGRGGNQLGSRREIRRGCHVLKKW